MKRPLAYITAAWRGEPKTDMEIAARYCRMAYEAGFSPICPILYLPLFINDASFRSVKSQIHAPAFYEFAQQILFHARCRAAASAS